MGASLTMMDRHSGHLARDGREHAIKLLDALNAPEFELRRASLFVPLPLTCPGDQECSPEVAL
jgi:hypothetical protein